MSLEVIDFKDNDNLLEDEDYSFEAVSYSDDERENERRLAGSQIVSRSSRIRIINWC